MPGSKVINLQIFTIKTCVVPRKKCRAVIILAPPIKMILIFIIFLTSFFLFFLDWWSRTDTFFVNNWNNSSLFTYNGVRQWTVQDCSYFHITEDSSWWDWISLHLSDIWEVYSCSYDTGEQIYTCVYENIESSPPSSLSSPL